MRIGVPREIKDNEFRVGLTPASVHELTAHGHEILIERGAGAGSGLTDAEFTAAGARVVEDAARIFAESELIVKVKEPQPVETGMLRKGQMLFTYLHLAPAPELTRQLLDSGATCIAYETVTSASGGLPLLTPMSEVAGRLAAQVGAHYLEREAGGRGILLGGVPGVPPADVLVLGAGVAGTHAATIALGMGADVTLIDRNLEALRRASAALGPGVQTLFSTRSAIAERIRRADLVIGTVLVPGAQTPKLVTREMVTSMKQGSVIIDISADQGGCCETTRPTTHSQPTYVVDGVVHYCVTNMPGAVPRTSTFALNNATLPFVIALAAKGWRKAVAEDPHLRNGLNVHEGKLTCEPVAVAQGLPYVAPESL
jgi:alanine dehydrogenase